MGNLRALHSSARNGTGSDEYYTPAHIVQPARAVLGGIALDPASCAEANAIIQADRYYSEADNGMAQPWLAPTMWLNAPFSKNNQFVPRAVAEYRAGNIGQALILTPARTETQWFACLYPFLMCFFSRRLRFSRPVRRRPRRRRPARPGLRLRLRPARRRPALVAPAKRKKKGSGGAPFPPVVTYLGDNSAAFIEHFSQYGPIVRAIAYKPVIYQSSVVSNGGSLLVNRC